MIYYEKDFYQKSDELRDAIVNEYYMNLCNSNSQVNIISQFVFLFKQYYTSVGILLSNQQSSSIYPIARSACECFSSIYKLIEASGSTSDFDETMKKEYQSNVSQLWRICKNLQAGEYRTKIFERIKKILLELKEINGAENDNEIINKCKSYSDNISEKVRDTFKNIPEYATDEESYKNLYPELCLYSHNNIDSIIERFFDKKEEGVVFNELKADNNKLAIMHMFVACANYILKWVKKVCNYE